MLSPLILATLLLHAVSITATPICHPVHKSEHHVALAQNETAPDASASSTLPSSVPSSAVTSTVPDSGSGDTPPTGGVYNPFANPNKTVEVTLKVKGKHGKHDKGDKHGKQSNHVRVTGVSAQGVDAFLGIPFAAPRE